MRVLFLTRGVTMPSTRYRVTQHLPHLEKAGVDAEVCDYPGDIWGYAGLLKRLGRYDIVFIQRKRPLLPFMRLVRRYAKRIVYDFDDAVMYRSTRRSQATGKGSVSLTRHRRFADMMRICDYVIAGNRFLEEKARNYTDRVTVVPTPIDIHRYRVKEPVPRENITIGWIGSKSSFPYLSGIREVFEELGRRYRHVELKIICNTFFEGDHIRVIKKPWSDRDEIDDLRTLDVGVMPLFDDPWSWGKCGLKILQYGGVGIPAVCSPIGVNRDVVKDGVNGFWASTEEEWVDKLSVLIENHEQRVSMGARARELVVESFSVDACAPRVYRILEEVASSRTT